MVQILDFLYKEPEKWSKITENVINMNIIAKCHQHIIRELNYTQNNLKDSG